MLKYRSLESLLQSLSGAIAAGQLVVSASWRSDEQSLGLLKPDEPTLAAYVYTHGQAPDRYGVHLDYPSQVAAGAASLTAEGISLTRLCDLLASHFDLHQTSS